MANTTNKDEAVQLELQVESRDEATVNQVASALQSVDVKRWPAARMDPLTILAIAAGTAKLITALLELKEKLSAQKNPPPVKVSNAAGAELDLFTATESILEEFLKSSK